LSSAARAHTRITNAHGRFALQVTLPWLPRELEAHIWRFVWRERDAAVRIQAAVRGAIVRDWDLPVLMSSHVSNVVASEMVQDMHHTLARYYVWHYALNYSESVLEEVD
jgi:hypothetical protein